MSTHKKDVNDNQASVPMTQNESSSLTIQAEIAELPAPINARNDGGQSALQRDSNPQQAQLAPPGFDMRFQPDTTLEQAITEIDFPDDHFDTFIEELEDKEFFQRHGVRPEQRQVVIQDPRSIDQLHNYMEEIGSRVGAGTSYQGSIRFERSGNDKVDSVLYEDEVEDESFGVEEVDEEE